jgi:dTDP-4-amino-4,6-dideoxygalactose transaminase
MRMLRTHGWKKKYYSEEVGYNSRLDALQAAILQAKLPYVDEWNQKRRGISRRYSEQFALLGVIVPVECDWGRHVYHLYIVRSNRRDELQAFLRQNGIASEVYYPLPPHLSTPCRKFGYQEGNFPHAERASRETLALPLYPELTEAQQDQVIGAVSRFVT